jgi:hypothetical protein
VRATLRAHIRAKRGIQGRPRPWPLFCSYLRRPLSIAATFVVARIRDEHLIMVAEFNRETFAPTLHTPEPISSDPDDVRLALEAARAFEEIGDGEDAVEWLERAAERAAQVGQHERAVALLQAIAALMKRRAPSAHPASVARSDVRHGYSVTHPSVKLPPCPPLRARVSSLRPLARTSSLLPPPPRKSLPPAACKSSLPPVPMLSLATPVAPKPAHSRSSAVASSSASPLDASSPKGPPRASAPPKRSSRVSAPASVASASHAKTIRVAIAGLAAEVGSFTIEQLTKGQPLPADTHEATLTVFDDERTIKVAVGRARDIGARRP